MSDERSDNGGGPAGRSWLERLGHALLGEPRDQEELLELLRDAQRRDLLGADALAMIEGVIQVSEMRVRDIMVPRSQMVVLERDWPPERLLAEITASGHSRFPVIGDSRDEVLGILLVKDLLRIVAEGGLEQLNLRDLLRPVRFIPESKRLNVLLAEFRLSRLHMAIVVDEYGGVAGLVTIEDVLEQIVGDIDDEHDSSGGDLIRQHGPEEYIVKALTPIEDFNEFFQADLSEEDFDTIGGLVIQQLGRVPRRGDSLKLGRFHFIVLRADSRRVHLLRVIVQPGSGAGAEEGAAG